MTPTAPNLRPVGDLLIWVLIVSELAVFCAGLLGFLALRATDPDGFAQAQTHLNGLGASINTILLISSGFLAALATDARRPKMRKRFLLWGASLLGVGFLVLKGQEYAGHFIAGISFETHPFFMFYFLLTGFHAAHVVAGIVVLLLISYRCERESLEDGVAFWHMVDLVWVLLYPILYLLR